jgi:hypothetical protein
MSLQNKRSERQKAEVQLKGLQDQLASFTHAAKQIPHVKKIPELQALIGRDDWTRTHEIDSLIQQMGQLRVNYQASMQSGSHSEVDATLNKAITYAEQQLHAHQYNMKMLAKKISMLPHVTGVKLEDVYVKKVIDAFRDYTKQMNAFREPLQQADRQKLSAIYEHMMVLKASRTAIFKNKSSQGQGNEQIKNEILTTFEKLKEVVGQALVTRQQEVEVEISLLAPKLATLDEEIVSVEQSLLEMNEVAIAPLNEVEKVLRRSRT